MVPLVRLLRTALLAVVAVLAAGCGRGPDDAAVREAVQQQLDSAFGGRVLAVEALRRAGGAPLKGEDGRLVYFNAELKLARDYDFAQWNAHSVASLANLLGAGPRGVIGMKPDGNRAGDAIGVYGTAGFVRSGSGWQLVAVARASDEPADEAPAPAARVAAVQPRPKEAPAPTALEAALDRLAGLTREPAGPTVSAAERDAILNEELGHAYRNARLRLEKKQNLILVAGGPPGGAYAETSLALRERAQAAGVALDTTTSDGSIGNVRLLGDRSVQFALVQNDIARSALLGRGRFAGAPQQELRAVASLFPEAVHLAVAPKSGISSIADLRGKRINLGPQGSGSRANALAILAANGIAVDALAASAALPLPEAVQALVEDKLDGVFATIHAPSRELQRAAIQTRLALVPLGPSRELLEGGLVPLTLPARTYAGQDGPVPTVAATALMVTRADVPESQVATILKLLFEAKGGTVTAAVAQIAPRTARAGVTLPWQPQADAFLTARGVPPVPQAAATDAAPATATAAPR